MIMMLGIITRLSNVIVVDVVTEAQNEEFDFHFTHFFSFRVTSDKQHDVSCLYQNSFHLEGFVSLSSHK